MEFINRETFTIPLRDKLTDVGGTASVTWQSFFRTVYNRLLPLGSEKYFDFVGGGGEVPTDPQDLVGMRFIKENETHIITELLIQRISTGVGAIEKVGSVVLHAFYRPFSDTWVLETGEVRGDAMSITFSLSSTVPGQVQFASSAIAGTRKVEKFTWRSRTKTAKIARSALGLT